MAQRGDFSHGMPEGFILKDRVDAAGYGYDTYLGESVAKAYSLAESVFQGWKDSPGHNTNMLNPNFKVISIGYVANGHHWTTDFDGFVDAPPGCYKAGRE